MTKLLMKGNEVIGEAAIQAGCYHFFGYPITPQSELVAYMAKRLPEEGGTFVQAESEVAAINMVYGAASAGVRAMTSSSSPGFSLKQEGISYLAGAELPAVIVNVARGGPGLGNIQPAQSDYFQATRGGGHGDYYTPVLAPFTLQETIELTAEAFRLADVYRTPVVLLTDGLLGQMMEPVVFQQSSTPVQTESHNDWALQGTGGIRAPRSVTSLELNASGLEKRNLKLQEKYQLINQSEQQADVYFAEDADWFVTAYGSVARTALSAVKHARSEGVNVGLIRPVSLWPFPTETYSALCEKTDQILVVEMSAGQMIDDVKLSVNSSVEVVFYGRMGGAVPDPEEIFDVIIENAKGVPKK
ncbi:3-methyl-2-oxobutanoate dehydrogenase subunit VorB [Salisediminibacterium halotolerans]|uniref:3-methyl-2-oxobutanoate dehydrogenase subunit VorB n=1 Tax=Salisediminibacterium halotolerans TaxID=517425 RepID=UPI000EADF050|nr:3-methyl-2-oxobutanoate dehydrogenase subunit VorB [Salisediminibacterium halotolerans]RLJ77972.1 2-oxoglutarate ferredoxin oxidoreductase subunit alpha [Actinophytocola xinjiangensis]RPE88690.1 2-oxoglutarate ferredoxin oxidoreductase subunit alpha [Salisediminibacterium halotolerans]TWG36949.1 2-oxoglutarate ferredoxin oxidoreductase subunit alpha [Salisediminibacterium halotolerans]GEL08090.1 3-methyl-2-oxobutanoate dehydrogenase subunit VorB [Salisediminibacterium halotolerans]